jgi:Glycosyl transferase family 2
MNELAPIAVFAYKRLTHLRQTIDALATNPQASNSDIYIFSDGPKNENEVFEIKQIRDYLNEVVGFKSVNIIKREKNLGLSLSIINGVTYLTKKFGKVVVIEDDVMVNSYTIDYLNAALERYKGVERVMHISAYMYPIETDGLPETFFLPIASCWGWATWDRAWNKFNKDPKLLMSTFSSSEIKEFNLKNSYRYWDQVVLNKLGKMDTWAVFWYASIFLSKGVCLHPRFSMVNNIGNDGSGENCRERAEFNVSDTGFKVNLFEDGIEVNDKALRRVIAFFNTINQNYLIKILLKIKISLLTLIDKI